MRVWLKQLWKSLLSKSGLNVAAEGHDSQVESESGGSGRHWTIRVLQGDDERVQEVGPALLDERQWRSATTTTLQIAITACKCTEHTTQESRSVWLARYFPRFCARNAMGSSRAQNRSRARSTTCTAWKAKSSEVPLKEKLSRSSLGSSLDVERCRASLAEVRSLSH